jgi:hypothetical protein
MPLRRILVNVVGDGTESELSRNAFRPAVADLLAAHGINWTARDLRLWEEQESNSGHMLITVDVPDSLLPQLQAAASVFVEVPLGLSPQQESALKAELDSRLGTEEVSSSGLDDYIEKIARVRDQRRQKRERKL